MTYTTLIEKMRLSENKIVTREELVRDCKKLNIKYEHAIGYLLKHAYLVKILRGIFYIKSLEERSYKKIAMPYTEAIARALYLKGVKNWYFGLESAIKLNNLTHEHIVVETIVSDTIYRNRPLRVLDHTIKFIKAKKDLFSFGITKGDIPHSDVEKTILDMIHLDKYNGRKDTAMRNKITEYLDHADRAKILKYSKHYSKSVQTFIQELYDST